MNFFYQLNLLNRAIVKLMLNALFGKMLQNTINKTFREKHLVTNWDIANDKNGEKVDKTDVKHKPKHLGSFILGAARRLW